MLCEDSGDAVGSVDGASRSSASRVVAWQERPGAAGGRGSAGHLCSSPGPENCHGAL